MREKLKVDAVQRPFDLEAVEAAVKSARKAAFEALGLPDPVARKKSKLAVQDPFDRQKAKAAIEALNAASGGRYNRAAALAAEMSEG